MYWENVDGNTKGVGGNRGVKQRATMGMKERNKGEREGRKTGKEREWRTEIIGNDKECGNKRQGNRKQGNREG